MALLSLLRKEPYRQQDNMTMVCGSARFVWISQRRLTALLASFPLIFSVSSHMPFKLKLWGLCALCFVCTRISRWSTCRFHALHRKFITESTSTKQMRHVYGVDGASGDGGVIGKGVPPTVSASGEMVSVIRTHKESGKQKWKRATAKLRALLLHAKLTGQSVSWLVPDNDEDFKGKDARIIKMPPTPRNDLRNVVGWL